MASAGRSGREPAHEPKNQTGDRGGSREFFLYVLCYLLFESACPVRRERTNQVMKLHQMKVTDGISRSILPGAGS